MTETTLGFYDALADYYHLIFDEWDQSIDRQARTLHPIISAQTSQSRLKILDCACGIGTQAIGFAKAGHQVVASDLSPAAVARAKREAEQRGLAIEFHVSDMTSLTEIVGADFNVVAALDNALPHLSADEVEKAMRAISSKLAPGGLFIASIRDYDRLIKLRPTVQGPAFCGNHGERRIVLQVWDWIDNTRYIVHLYITVQSEGLWTSHHFASEYRCLLRDELSNAFEGAGFQEVTWIMPPESGSYQPLVLAKKRELSA